MGLCVRLYAPLVHAKDHPLIRTHLPHPQPRGVSPMLTLICRWILFHTSAEPIAMCPSHRITNAVIAQFSCRRPWWVSAV